MTGSDWFVCLVWMWRMVLCVLAGLVVWKLAGLCLALHAARYDAAAWDAAKLAVAWIALVRQGARPPVP